jgi:peptide/nickel transport system substrate-binding protein
MFPVTISHASHAPFPIGHFNQFVSKGITLNTYGELHESPLTWYLWSSDRYLPVLAERWGFEGGEHFAVTLKQGVKWSDGQPLTAKDLVATFTALRLYNSQLFQYVDRFEARDERTVAFHMQVPSTVVERYVLRQRIRSAAVYGQFTDRAYPLYQQGRGNDDAEVKAIRGEFDQFRPTDWPASGPYMLDRQSLTEASCELVRNPNGVGADSARFDKIKLYVGITQVTTPLILGKQEDFSHNGFAVATDRQMQAQGIRVLRTPVHGGPAIHINFANPKLKVFNDKRVRQALAHAIKREDNAAVSLGESGKAVKYMAGFSDNLAPRWLSPTDLGKLNQYPHDPRKAEGLLTAAGCRKGDTGQWSDPDGRPMAYELLLHSDWIDWAASGQDWADQMTRFGIKITVRAVTYTQVPVERREGRFELAYDGWGTGNPHPHFSFVATLLNKVQPLANGAYIAFDLKQQTDAAGEVDFRQLITDSARGLDVEKQKENILKVTLAFNELLPTLPIWERYGNGPALDGVRVTGWPAAGDPIYENTLYGDNFVNILIHNGTLGPV